MRNSVELLDITKSFPGVLANNRVTLKVRERSVVCLVGENGTGKSTLMNILSGNLKPDSGRVIVNGEVCNFRNTQEAIDKKIGMVYQHFMLSEELTVLENIIMGCEPRKGLIVDRKRAYEELSELMETYNMKLPLNKRVAVLPVGVKQKIEILKILYRGANIIILDEPTAVLTPQETRELFDNIKSLTKLGKSIIFISHKLDEVMEVADDIAVMRRGEMVFNTTPQETSKEEIAYYMVGESLPSPLDKLENKEGNDILELKGVSHLNSEGMFALKKLNLSVKRGEIIGIAGVSGNGQSELAKVISGLERQCHGEILLNGRDISGDSRRSRIAEGVAYIPEDRKKDGLCMSWDIEENIIAGFHRKERYYNSSKKIFRFENIREHADELIKMFRIKTPASTALASSLSGGNQQKIIIARETINNPSILIAAEPTRGVDIGAISFIHDYFVRLRNEGVSILLISSDLDEIFKLSDRVAVLYDGEITFTGETRSLTKETLGKYMVGIGEK